MSPENNVPTEPEKKIPDPPADPYVANPTPVNTSLNSTEAQQPVPTSSSFPAAPISQASVGSSNKKKKRMLLIGIVAAVFVVFGGSAAAYFGVIVPSKPENVWKKSLENTGKGYDKLIEYAEKNKDIKGSKLSGNFKFEGGGIVADGTIESKNDEKNSESKLTVGAAGVRVELDLLTTIPDGSKNPDIYAKVSGLKGIDQLLGPTAGGVGASLASFENQWYVVDHTLLDQLEKSAGQEAAAFTAEDATAFAKDMGEVVKQYVLTDDPSKAVLEVKQNVGKETLDGRSVYHFKVGFHKENLKAFSKAACEKLTDSKLGKTLATGAVPLTKADCNDTKSIDAIKDTDTFDVYVDLKTKLIRIIRIAEKDKQENYFDFGLLYNGGDEYPFVFRGQTKSDSGDGKGELKITLNTKTDKFSVNGTIDGKDNGQTIKFTLTATAEPSSDKVEFKKPEGAKSLLEAFGGLLGGVGGLPGVTGTGGASPPSSDLFTKCTAAFEEWANSNGRTAIPPECETLSNGL